MAKKQIKPYILVEDEYFIPEKTSDVFKEVKKSTEDGILDKKEQDNILKEIEEAQKANAELRDIVLHMVTKGAKMSNNKEHL